MQFNASFLGAVSLVVFAGTSAMAQPGGTQPAPYPPPTPYPQPAPYPPPAPAPTAYQPPSVYGAPAVPQPFRQGFYVGIGFGVGGLEFTDDDGESLTDDRENAGTGNLRFGGAVSPKLLIGGNIGGWSKRFGDSGFDDGVTLTMANVTLEATFYPLLNPGGIDVYVRGGIGGSRIAITDENTGEEYASESGTAYNFGVGIEKQLGRRVALGFGLNLAGGEFDGGGANYIDGALQLTWY